MVSERCTGKKYCKPTNIGGKETTTLMKPANRFACAKLKKLIQLL
jgi:hypothetical protein